MKSTIYFMLTHSSGTQELLLCLCFQWRHPGFNPLSPPTIRLSKKKKNPSNSNNIDLLLLGYQHTNYQTINPHILILNHWKFVCNEFKKDHAARTPPPSSFTTKQEWTEASLFNTIENNSRKKSFKSWAPHQMSCQNLTFYTIATPTLNIGCKSPLTWLDTSPKTTPYVPWTIAVDYWPQSCPDDNPPPTTTLSL